MFRIELISDPTIDNHGHDRYNPAHVNAQQVCDGDASSGIWFKAHAQARELFLAGSRIQGIVYLEGLSPDCTDEVFIEAWYASRGAQGREFDGRPAAPDPSPM